jgi:hypothetical protein
MDLKDKADRAKLREMYVNSKAGIATNWHHEIAALDYIEELTNSLSDVQRDVARAHVQGYKDGCAAGAAYAEQLKAVIQRIHDNDPYVMTEEDAALAGIAPYQDTSPAVDTAPANCPGYKAHAVDANRCAWCDHPEANHRRNVTGDERA